MTNSKSSDKSFSPNNQTTNQNPDSKTSDVTYISVHDSRLTVRINSRLKEAFLGHCRAKGLSACHILEGLLYGYLKGFYDKLELDVKSPTINLTLVRDVKRVRSYGVEFEGEATGGVGRFVDFYDDEATLWRRVKVEDDSDVNGHGHLVGCQCSVCRKEVTRR
jgi:hypothetical protein